MLRRRRTRLSVVAFAFVSVCLLVLISFGPGVEASAFTDPALGPIHGEASGSRAFGHGDVASAGTLTPTETIADGGATAPVQENGTWEPAPPGSAHSIFEPRVPATSNVDRFALTPAMSRSPEGLRYETATGTYVIPNGSEFFLRASDFDGSTIFRDAFFSVVASGATKSVSEVAAPARPLVDASASQVRVSYSVVAAGAELGVMEVTIEFLKSELPKLSAHFVPTKASAENLSVVWVVPLDSSLLNVGGDAGIDTRQLSEAETVPLGATRVRVEPVELGRRPFLLDWSDAAVNATVIIEPTWADKPDRGATLQIRFEPGEMTIDPAGGAWMGSSFAEATAYSPQRKLFQHNGLYWAFWFDDYIESSWSADGITWTTPSLVPSSNDAKAGFDVAILGTTVGIAYVNEAATSLRYIEGELVYQAISWTAPTNVAGCACVLKVPAIAMSPLSGVFIALTYTEGTNSKFQVNRRDWGSSSWPTNPEFVDQVSGTSGYTTPAMVVSTNGTAYAFVFGTSLNRFDYRWYGPIGWSSLAPSATGVMTAGYTREDKVSVLVAPNDFVHVYYVDTSGSTKTLERIRVQTLSTFAVESIHSTTATMVYPSASIDLNGDVHLFWVSNAGGFSNVQYLRQGQGAWIGPTTPFALTSATDPVWVSAAARAVSDVVAVWTRDDGLMYAVDAGILPLPSSIGPASFEPWSRSGLSPYQSYFGQLADYVNPATGILTVKQDDLVLPGRGLDVAITRVYQQPQTFISGAPYLYETTPYGSVGLGWSLNFPWIGPSFVHLWNGQTVYVDWDASGTTFVYKGAEAFTLVKGGSGYTLTAKSGSRYEFNLGGRVTSIVDSSGNAITFTLLGDGRIDKITDTVGRILQFGYDGSNRLSTITTGTRTLTYTYTTASQLATAKDPLNRATLFNYKGSTGKEAYLLGQLTYPTGGYTWYDYDLVNGIQVGTEAKSYPITLHEVYLSSGKVRSTSYSYESRQGRVQYTSLTHREGQNTIQGYTEYNFRKAGEYTTTTKFDASHAQVEKTRSWYGPQGAPSQTDTYAGNSQVPTSSSTVAFDDWGNQVSARDPLGHESFASYANTDSENAFRGSGQLALVTDGKVLHDSFDDFNFVEWSQSGSGTVTIDTSAYEPFVPSLSIEGSILSTKTLTRTFAAPSVPFTFELRIRPGIPDGSAPGAVYVLGQSASATQVYLGFREVAQPGVPGHYRFSYKASSGSWVDTCGSYAPLQWHRLTVEVDIQSQYHAYLDGQEACRSVPFYQSGSVDRIAIQVDSPTHLGAAWIDEVKVFKGSTATVRGLRPGQVAALVDPNGLVMHEARSTATEPDVVLKGTSETYLGSGVWRYFEFGPDSLRVYSESRLLEYVAPFREFWGGSVYQYTRPVEVAGLARTESGFGRWQNLLVDDAGVSSPPSPPTIYHDGDGNGAAPDYWSWLNEPAGLPVSGVEYHASPWSLGTHQHYFDSASLPTPASGQFHIQYIRFRADQYPAEVMLQFASAGTWDHRAFWGSPYIPWGTYGTPSQWYMNAAIPYRPDEWVMLIVKADDVDTDGLAFSGLGYTLYGGAAMWDASALGDANTGLVRVSALQVGQRVDLLRLDNVLLTSYTVGVSDGNTAKLNVYAANLNAFPYRARFKVYATDGSLEYVSPPTDIYGGDTFTYTKPDFYVNSAASTIHNRVVGNLGYRTTASLDALVQLDMETTVPGGQYRDVSFSGRHGTAAGGLPVTGVIGNALSFDGTNQHVAVGDIADFVGTAPFTVAAWVKRSTDDHTWWPEIVSKETLTSPRQGWHLYMNPASQGNTIAFARFTDGTPTAVVSSTQTALGTWYHAAATYDGATLRLYVNGVLESSTASTNFVRDHAFPVRIGSNSETGWSGLNGAIDEPTILDRALSATDVGVIYRTQLWTGGHPIQRSFTKYTSTGLGNQTKAAHNGVWTTTYSEYDAYGNQIKVAAIGGRTNTYEYSALYGSAYLTKITQPLGVVSTFAYDFATGMRTQEVDPNGGVTDHTYDKLLRILTTTYPLVGVRHSISYAYDDTSNTLTITDELGRKIRHTYDAIGRETKVERLNGDGSVYSTESFTYDWEDRVKTQTTAAGSTYTTAYDALGRVTRVTNPDVPGVPSVNLFPNGAGTSTQWSRTGCALNHECVDDASPDGDTTYVSATTTGYADLYALPDITQFDSIVSVTVTAVARGYPVGGCSNPDACYGALNLRLNGYASFKGVTDYAYESVSETWTTNPATGLPWTRDEMNALEVGVEKATGTFSTPETRVTQVYVTVLFGPSIRTVAYDDVANRVTATDEVGRVVRYSYDLANRLVKVEERNPADATHNATDTTYDGTGSVVSVNDPDGLVTTHVYDDVGRLAVTIYPDAARTTETYAYDAVDNLVSKTKRDGAAVSFQYNALDRLTKITYPGSYVVDYSYDKIGNTKKVVNSNATLWYEYDARDRMTKEASLVDGTNFTTEYVYDGASNLATMTYPDSVGFAYTVDAFNRVGSVKSGSSVYGTFTYRADDRISTASFGNGASTLYAYDSRTRPVRIQTSATALRPNAAGDTTQWTKSGGGGANWDRVDETNRDDDTTYVKAIAGNKIDKYNLQDYSLAPGESVSAVEVHVVARQTTATANAQLKARVNGAESAAVPLTTTYTEYIASWATDPTDGGLWSQADVTALQAGQTLSAIASGEARVTQVWVVLRTNKPILDLTYTYNPAGDVIQLVTTRSASTWTETFSYDGQDRLAKWTASGANAFSHTFHYDAPWGAAGDRTSLVEDGNPWSYTYDNDHRLTGYSKTGYAASLTYDANGNAVTRTINGIGYTYSLDAEDRLTVAKQGGTTLGTYSYDGLGRRVKALESGTTTYFVYSGLSLIYTKVDTTITKYVYASGLLVDRIVGSTPTYFHQDHLGSTRAVTDANRVIVFGTQYKPFGAEYGTTGTDAKLKFTGQHRDAPTGLYYLFRRFYDPEIGRFLGQDRILGHLTVPQSLVRYAYTVNNPLRYVDPTGEDWTNPLSWGADVSAGLSAAGTAVGNWWSSSSVWDKLDMAMTIIGFIPGVDVISDAYFLGRAVADVLSGRGSWQDVGLAAFALVIPVGAGVIKLAKKFLNGVDSLTDLSRAASKVAKNADGAKAVGTADGIGDAAKATPKAGDIASNPGQTVRKWPSDPKDLPDGWKKGAWTDLPESRGGGRQMIAQTDRGNLVVTHTGHPKQRVHQTLHYQVFSPDPLRPGRYVDRGTYFPGQIIEPWV